MKIGSFNLDEDSKTFIVAELSANHNQVIKIAIDTIHAAKDAGADAIKLQTYTPDTLTIDCDNDYFKIQQGTLWDGKTLYELYKEAYTPWEWFPELFDTAKKCGLICFSSPFDKTAVDFLQQLDGPAFKIASFEITDIPLIEYTAKQGKPILISTGIAELDDIKLAVDTIRKTGNNDIIILKCTSSYPAPFEEANLLTIPDIAQTFNTFAGLSDHTTGISVPVASVALGAKVIEKHLIIDRKIGGPDAAFSLEPYEFKAMVESVRETEKALGKINYTLSDKVRKNKVFARSLFIVEDIAIGETLTTSNIRSIRPGYGLHPKYYAEVLGKKAKTSIKRGSPLNWDLIR